VIAVDSLARSRHAHHPRAQQESRGTVLHVAECGIVPFANHRATSTSIRPAQRARLAPRELLWLDLGVAAWRSPHVGVSVDFHLKLFFPDIRFQTCQMCDLAPADRDALMHHHLLADQDALSTHWQANDPTPLPRNRARF
jgi:hypothetical protein